jgi:heme exporter protein B
MIAPGVVWVGALLSSLLALESLFKADREDGTLEQIVLTGQPLAVLLLGKLLAHWCVSGWPLVLAAPVVGLMLGVPVGALGTLMVALWLGTGVMSFVGGASAALTLGAQKGSVLLSLLVLPLVIPVLIFGARATELAMHSESAAGPVWLLVAAFMFTATLAPIATSAAVRIGLE